MNTKMTLEEYKAKVLDALLKRYPTSPEEDWKPVVYGQTISKGLWEQYMEDFSPEELPGAWAAGA